MITIIQTRGILITASGIFYSILCIFSLVTGIIYMSGKRELNPLELSDRFVAKLDTQEKRNAFTRKMGLVTFLVGIVQGLTAYALFFGTSPFAYALALGFTLFSIASASFKLKGKINAFPIMKLFFYTLILIILVLETSRNLYF